MFDNNYKINWISKSGRHYTQWCKELSDVQERVEMNFRNRIETTVTAGDDGRTVGEVWNGDEGWTWFCENDEDEDGDEDIDPSDYYTMKDKIHDQGYRRSEQLARWEY